MATVESADPEGNGRHCLRQLHAPTKPGVLEELDGIFGRFKR